MEEYGSTPSKQLHVPYLVGELLWISNYCAHLPLSSIHCGYHCFVVYITWVFGQHIANLFNSQVFRQRALYSEHHI